MYIKKSTWYKLPETLRNKIRSRELKYDFNYKRAAKDKILKKLYERVKNRSIRGV